MAKAADPLSIRTDHHTPRELIAESRCGSVKVLIYKNGDPQMTKLYHGNAQWLRGAMVVDLSAELFKPGKEARLARVLLHEFTHVVEYANSHEFLSPQTTDENCTELAQAMEDGLGDLYERLRAVGAGGAKLGAPKARPRKARK